MIDVRSYRNKYKGQPVFMIGNGPSLSITPLDRLQGTYSFAMNRISRIYNKVKWRPSFFVCTTKNIAREDWRRDIVKTMTLGVPSFVWDKIGGLIAPYRFQNVCYINCTHGDEKTDCAPDDWWSWNVSQRVCKFGTSMLPALQIAIYMGFNPIYLLGCDLGFKSVARESVDGQDSAGDTNHFDDCYGTPGFTADQLNVVMPAAHDLARRAAEIAGVSIYNATIGGSLEVYPRVDLEEVLSSLDAHRASEVVVPSANITSSCSNNMMHDSDSDKLFDGFSCASVDKKQKYTVTLLGYTSPNHSNWYPWKMFYRVFLELGYPTEWIEADDIDPATSIRRIFICWNVPDAKTLVASGKIRPGDVVVQKLTSLGKGCERVNWGNDALEFFKNWTWPIYKSVEDLYDSGVNIYAFGCRTNTELFPEKNRICQKLKDRIFWIPWGSSVYSWGEIQNARPVMDGFFCDIGFVGSIWGTVGRGNIDGIRDYLQPLLSGRKCMLAGNGTQLGPIDDNTHKGILRRSKLCPIVNAASWRAEKGVQDRFWTVFTTGRFGVVDSEGVYDFFDEKDVVCETEPGEYVEKSLYFLRNVEKQLPYIEIVQSRIKKEYNYYTTWNNVLSKIIAEQ